MSLVFSFLPLNEKLLILPSCSRTTYEILQCDFCYRHDKLHIRPALFLRLYPTLNLSEYSSLVRVIGAVSHLSIVVNTHDEESWTHDYRYKEKVFRSFTQSIDVLPEGEIRLLPLIVRALARDSLTAFTFKETIEGRSLTTSVVMKHIMDEIQNQANEHLIINLTSLRLEMFNFVRWRGSNPLQWVDFRPLFQRVNPINQPLTHSKNQSRSLATHPVINRPLTLELDFSMFECNPREAVPGETLMLKSLPVACTNVKIIYMGRGRHEIINPKRSWNEYFADPDWLPFAEHLEFDVPINTSPTLCTFMNATGRPRPFRNQQFRLADDTLLWSNSRYPYDPFEQLEELNLIIDRGIYRSLDHFIEMQTQLPALKKVSFTDAAEISHSGATSDLSPFLIFLSHKKIESLTINHQRSHNGEWSALSDAAVQALGRMSELKELSFVTRSCFDWRWFANHDIRRLINVNAWPNLTRLKCTLGSLTDFEACLTACPSLTYLQYNPASSIPFCPIATLAFINRFSYLLQEIRLSTPNAIQPPQPSHLVLLSLVKMNLQHLNNLVLDCPNMSSKTLHMVIQMVKLLPIHELSAITHYDSRGWQPNEENMRLLMSFHLPSLKFFGLDWGGKADLRDWQRTLPDGRTFPFQIIPGEAAYNDSFMFADGVDEQNRTAQEVCRAELIKKLSQNQLQLLEAWNAGQYDVDGWQLDHPAND